MKILFVSSSFRGGGITSYAHEVIKAFSGEHELSVIIGNDDVNPFDQNSVNVYKCEMTDVSICNARLLLKLINHEIKPTLIINSNALLMSLVLPYVDDSIRVISVSHSLRYNEADVAGFNSKYVDNIIALSAYNKLYLCSQYGIKDTSKVHVIYNFVEDNPQAETTIEMKKRANPIRIVFAGGTSAAKSPELVYDIMQDLLQTDRRFEFYFMGNNSPTLKSIQRYKSLQELFNPDSRVIFTGRIQRAEAEKIINTANIFLVPSRREGCPMAMLEAMRSGTIVITSDYKNACREMIENQKNGFVINHRNRRDFVRLIIDIIDHHDKYFRFYDECMNNFKTRFSYAIWQERMNDIIHLKQRNHTSRIKFSEKRYKLDAIKIRIRMNYNKYHMLLFETLRSAIPFYVKYLTR